VSELTLGSLFDGIGGWLLAAEHSGIEPLWRAEIDDYPRTVSEYHFPNVKSYTDVRGIDGAKVEPVDILCAGSPCFLAGTMIQTEEGLKPIEEVSAEDSVIGDDCKWHKVLDTMVNPTDSVYTIYAQGMLETKATGNHPFYVRHMKRKWFQEDGKRALRRVFSEPEYVAASDLQKGDFLGFPILDTAENPLHITEEEAWLIGRYIADGYINNNQRPHRPEGQINHKTIFCVCKDKLDAFQKHLHSYHACCKPDATVYKCEIINERLMNLCLLCKKGAENKEIPPIFLNLPKNLLQELLQGYMSGDGCRIGNKYQATTISRKLALSIQTAVHKAFELPTKVYFCKRPQKHVIEGRTVNQHDTYLIAWLENIPKQTKAIVADGYIWQPIRRVEQEKLHTDVYNLEVETVHSYTANGVVVHNCQNLSLSGNRLGLKGSESLLFFEAIRIFREMREATNGEKPRFFVWENVCGAFSSNGGNDFRAVLEEITEARIPFPRSHKWIHAGLVRSSKCDAAWRVLDAQYFGVAQRRKRIFLVADFGAEARCAEQILFVEAGVRRDPAEGEGAREGSPEASCRCAYEAGGATVLKIRQPKVKGRGGSGAQYQADQSYTLATNQDQTLFDGREKKPETYVLCSKHSNGMRSPNPDKGCVYASDTTRTLDRQGGNPCCNQGGLLIVDSDTKTFGQDTNDKYSVSNISPTLLAAGGNLGGGSETLVAHPYCIGNGQICELTPSFKSSTLDCMHDQKIVVQHGSADERKVGTLSARDYKGVGTPFVNEGKLVTDKDYNKKLVGALCARDYKGPGNSHSLGDGKLILQ